MTAWDSSTYVAWGLFVFCGCVILIFFLISNLKLVLLSLTGLLLSLHMPCVGHGHRCEYRKPEGGVEGRKTWQSWHSQSPQGEGGHIPPSTDVTRPSGLLLSVRSQSCSVTEETRGVILSSSSCSLSDITPQIHSFHTKKRLNHHPLRPHFPP